HFWTYALEKRKKGTVPVLPKDKRMLHDVAMTKKSIETYVFCQCLSYGILTGLGLAESKGILNGLILINPCQNSVSYIIPIPAVYSRFHRYR
ncbi:MAG: hypothetical protein LBK74_00945, partial [Treponema sp.]|nr:hypothetical protein [Treponema sp.]